MEYFLRQLVHEGEGFHIPLNKKVTVIGEDCFPGLNGYHNLSSQHTKFTRKDRDEWFVEDLSSPHGTFVNGNCIGSRREIVSLGDQIGFGVRYMSRGFVCAVSAQLIPIKQEPQSYPLDIQSETQNELEQKVPDQPIQEEPPVKVIKLEVPIQQISAGTTIKHKHQDENIPPKKRQRGDSGPLNDYQSVQSQYVKNSVENNSKCLVASNENITHSSDEDVVVVSDIDDNYRGYSQKEEVIVISDDETQFDVPSGIKQDSGNGYQDLNVLLEKLRAIDFSKLMLSNSDQSDTGNAFNTNSDLLNLDFRMKNNNESSNGILDEEIKHSSPQWENTNDAEFNNNDSNSSVSSHDDVLYPTCVKRNESDVSPNAQEFSNESNELSKDVPKNKISNNKLHDAAKKKKKKRLQDRTKNSDVKQNNVIKTSTNDNDKLRDVAKIGNGKLGDVKKRPGRVSENIKTPQKNISRGTLNTQKVSKQKDKHKKVKLSHQKSSHCENIVIKESAKGPNSHDSYKIPKKSSSSQESNAKHSKKTPIVCKQSASRAEFLLLDTPTKVNLPKKNEPIHSVAVPTGQDLKSNGQGKNQNNKLPLSCSASPAKKPTTINKSNPLVQSLNLIQKDVSQSNDSVLKDPKNVSSKSEIPTHSTCTTSSETNMKSPCTTSPLAKSKKLTKDNILKYPGKLANIEQEYQSQNRRMHVPVTQASTSSTLTNAEKYQKHQYSHINHSFPNKGRSTVASTSSTPTVAEVYQGQLHNKQLEAANKKPFVKDYNHKSDNEASGLSMKAEPTPVANELSPKQLERATVTPYKRSSTENRSFNKPMTSEQHDGKLETTAEKPISRDPRRHSVDVSDSIMFSATEFPKPLTEIPANETNNFSMESVIQRIVEFNYMWLKEQQVKSSPPPPVWKGLKKLPLHFSSFNEYASFFLPMLMLEIWETLHQNSKILWTEPLMRANEFPFKIYSCENTLPLTKFHCGAIIERDSFHPTIGNVVLMRIQDLAGKHGHTILGYVYSHYPEEGKCSLNRNAESGTTTDLWFSVLVKARNFQPKCNVVFKGNVICSIRKYLNLLGALKNLNYSSLRENILVPNFEAFKIAYSSPEPLSDPQKLVIEGISKVITESTFSPNVVLLQGSYGAVKTHIIVSLLEKLIHTNGFNFKVMVTAPSNDAIDKIGRALMHLNGQLVKFVLINYPNEVSEELRAFTLDSFYNEQLVFKTCFDNTERELKDLYRQTRSAFTTERIQRLKAKRCDLRSKIVLRNNSNSVEMSDLLRNYSVVLAPLDRCYQSNLISRSKTKIDKNLFSCCIVDEATLCSELELLQVALNTRKLILVGDPQDSAIVLSTMARQNGYGRSMFVRFQKFATLVRGP